MYLIYHDGLNPIIFRQVFMMIYVFGDLRQLRSFELARPVHPMLDEAGKTDNKDAKGQVTVARPPKPQLRLDTASAAQNDPALKMIEITPSDVKQIPGSQVPQIIEPDEDDDAHGKHAEEDDEYDDEEEEDRPMEDFDPVSFILRLPCYSLTDLAYIRIIRKVTTMTTTRRKRKKKNTGATVDQQTVREALRVARHLLRCLHLPVHPLAHHQRCSAWRRLEAYPTSQ